MTNSGGVAGKLRIALAVVVTLTGGISATSHALGREAAAGANRVINEAAFGTKRLYVPPPLAEATDQENRLRAAGRTEDADLIATLEKQPRAAWFAGGSPASVQASVADTVSSAVADASVPVLVAYNIPGRDCGRYSAGGIESSSEYADWISGFAAGIGNADAIVVLEPDSLMLMPSTCGAGGTSTDDSNRYGSLANAVHVLESHPGVSVYLDGSHSDGSISVATAAERLKSAAVDDAQGFALNVSNFKNIQNEENYGTWISKCLEYEANGGSFSKCPDESATMNANAVSSWYDTQLKGAVPTAHFVIDTSRNGLGPDSMARYATEPFNQNETVVSTLKTHNWCNPPGAGVGARPTLSTGRALTDAYLWIKTPGNSDGTCDEEGGARAWDYSAYSASGWPTSAADRTTFDPLWGRVDPTAGEWFDDFALSLAQHAVPAL